MSPTRRDVVIAPYGFALIPDMAVGRADLSPPLPPYGLRDNFRFSRRGDLRWWRTDTSIFTLQGPDTGRLATQPKHKETL